jgi:DNA-binding transcriptional LysR family regulator
VIEDMPTPQQPEALSRGDIDLGLAHAYPGLTREAPLARERVYEDRIQAALLGVDHPLALRTRLAAADLAGVPLLFMDRDFHPQFYDYAMAALRAIGLEPKIEATYDGLQVVWSLAAQGKGWAFGFRSHLEAPPAGTVAVPVKGLDLPWGLDLLRRRAEPSQSVRRVVQVIREVARGGASAGAKRRRPEWPYARRAAHNISCEMKR